MKLRSFLLLSTSLFLLSCLASGQPVTKTDAKKIAEKVFSIPLKGLSSGIITGDSTVREDNQEPSLYIFQESKGGFMIISADKRVYPLLGWAETGTFSIREEDWPPAFEEMIINWREQVRYIRENNIDPSPEITRMWKSLESGAEQGFYGSKDVLPLLLTKWNQGCGYNALCPADPKGSCGRAYTGCVATAMAQVIRYNQHPVKGIGSKCYTHGIYGELCADFSSGTYDYASMSNTSGNSAVAKLMYHCGVSVSMNYGPYGSSAYSSAVAYAMRSYFDYTNGLIIGKSGYTEENWTKILMRELDNSRPLYYSGHGTSGHAFVLDGYKPTAHFHINWGWGGSYDGYFYLNSLNPGSMNFTSSQQAIVGMLPSSEFTGLDFSSAANLACGTPITASLSSGNDYVNYYKNTYPAAIGKELVFKFSTVLPGRIRIKITDQTGPLFTFLLNHSDKDSLLAYGTDGVTVDNTLPGTYYVVVEGLNGNEPGFTIEAVCPTSNADLDILSASVSPGYVQSLQTNVFFRCSIKNIGNTASAATSVEYFLSSDQKYDHSTDILLGSGIIRALEKEESAVVSSVITMPDGLSPGSYYVIFNADRENNVPETDDENIRSVYVSVPETGIMDCSASVSLHDNLWYHGNTLLDGSNIMEDYRMGSEMTGPEVIHTFTPEYNGIVRISFVEKSPGSLYAFVLPVCNEKTSETMLMIYNLTDTLISGEFFTVAGNQYFLVVDGKNGASGDYSLLVDLPGECPQIQVEYSGKTDLCEGDPWPGLWTRWGYSNYQWYKNGILIEGETNSYYTPSSPGAYHVEITENGCKGSSSPVVVRSDTHPDTARITSLGDTTFCQGSSVLLKLDNTVAYPVNWAKDGKMITGAAANTYSVLETGSYSLYTVNGACRVASENSIKVTVIDPPADIGDTIPFPSDKVRFYCPFNPGENNHGGVSERFNMIGWEYEPVDDRFGNFWQARYLMGEDEKFYWSDYYTIPEDFTLALWFKTTTVKGGVIAGFYDNPWQPAKNEAVLYMSDNGKVHFWLSNGGISSELSSSESYNDGRWHYIKIQHDGTMTLEVDDGAEELTSSGPASKDSFKGYWTFGGPVLPPGVSDRPSSEYFNGAVDDILCLDEANEYTTPYMVRLPKLSFSLTDDLPLCVPATVTFRMPFSQKGTEYKVRDRTRSLWAPVSAVSDGGYVQFGGAEVVTGINEFEIIARNIATDCETVLDTVIVVEVWSVCTLMSEDEVVAGLKVYPVPAKDMLNFESDQVIKEIRIIDTAGRIVHYSAPRRNVFVIETSRLLNGVYSYCLETEAGLTISGKVIIQN